MFTNLHLKKMIIPLFFEQLLVMMVGIADTFIVSYVSEAAVSGTSLVNSFNTIFIYLFTALASGGAVIVSQYIGKGESESAGESASQLLMISALFSLLTMGFILITHKWILLIMFGQVEPPVMDACITYLRISAYSYPAIAVYNAGAALYRSLGKTSTTMYISVLSNVINVAGNLIGVFVLRAGVAGVAYPSLIARVFSAAAITILCFRLPGGVRFCRQWIFKWNGSLLRKILNIAIPNGIENGIFQFVKVALSSVVALFGTYQIAANGVAQSIWSLAALVGVTMGPVFITVIGQCMGSGDIAETEKSFKKLVKLTFGFSIMWNIFIFALTPLMMRFFVLPQQTKDLVIILVLIHNIFNCVAFPLSGPLGNGLRAAGDVKFTMYISVISTIFARLLFSLLFGIVFDMGVIGIAFAMCLDWIIKAVLFVGRLRSGAWKKFKLV